VQSGGEIREFNGHFKSVTSVAFSPDVKYILTGSWDNTARLWDLESGEEIRIFSGHSSSVDSVAFSPDGNYILTGSDDSTARLWDVETGKEIRKFTGHTDDINSVAFSPDGKYILTGSDDSTARLWDVESGGEIRIFSGRSKSFLSSLISVFSVAFSPDGKYILTGSWDKTARLWDVETGSEVLKLTETTQNIRSSVAFSPDGNYILTGSDDKTARLWNVKTGREVRKFTGHTDEITSEAFSPDGNYILTGSDDSTARLWDVETGQELVKLVSFTDGTSAVVTPDGRFDTSNLEEIKGLHWVMPDDPMTPLPLEIFMQDYYEPRLLSRVLAGEKFEPIRKLQDLNRVQPKVKITKVKQNPSSPDTVKVTVEVKRKEREIGLSGKKRTVRAGVYDLHLFRDGQLVGYADGKLIDYDTSSNKYNGKTNGKKITVYPNVGKVEVVFDGIKIPRRKGLKKVEFSAYAFNVDRVKSSTHRQTYEVPDGMIPVKGRAYIISVGVNIFENPSWNLSFAANDARLIDEVLSSRIRDTGEFKEIVQVPMISDYDKDKKELSPNYATKENFKTVLDLLSGKGVEAERKSRILNGEKILEAQPEDLILISFSTHGYRDTKGNFYLLPHDTGKGTKKVITQDLLKNAISSMELKEWLREVDGGDMVIIVDACHSAATVEGKGFKPGPMGSRGLGQLAYNKGMRILAASQADEAALEVEGLKHGLLTYALIRDGIEAGRADIKPIDNLIRLSEWLEYGVARTPSLYDEVRTGRIEGSKGLVKIDVPDDLRTSKKDSLQQPSLFNFSKRGQREQDILIVNKFLE